MNEHKLNGLSNKELLVRVLNRLDTISNKLDTKAERSELQAMSDSLAAESLAMRDASATELQSVRSQIAKKVNRGEMFGWFGVVGTALTVALAVLL